MKRVCLFWIMLMLFGVRMANGQISVYPSRKNTPEAIVKKSFMGNGVKISNVKFNGKKGVLKGKKSVQFGTFTNNENGFPGFFSSGIILCTGNCKMAEGPNDHLGKTDQVHYFPPEECKLLEDIIASYSVNCPAVLEFDFSSVTSHVRFRYVFASEEYPQYSCSMFNDVFGFFVIDPKTKKPENIALIPGTNKVVSVNNIHPDYGKDCHAVYAEYLTMIPQGSPKMQFNGYVGPFDAIANLTPNKTYHMVLAISNVSDLELESAVFIEAASFNAVDDYGVVVGKDEMPGEVIGSDTLKERAVGGIPLDEIKNSTQGNGINLNGLNYSQKINPKDFIVTVETDHDFLFDTISASVVDENVYLRLHLRNKRCDCFVSEKIHATIVLTPVNGNQSKRIVIPYEIGFAKNVPWLVRCFWALIAMVALLVFIFYLRGLLKKNRFKKTARIENSYIEDENSRKETRKKGRLLRETGIGPWLNRWFNPFVDEKRSMSFSRPKTKTLTFVASESKERIMLSRGCYDERTMNMANYVPQPEGSGKKQEDIKMTAGEQIEIMDMHKMRLGHLTFTTERKDDESGYRMFVGILMALSIAAFLALLCLLIHGLI